MSLNVAIPDTFSGPLDLLLHLIRRDEMDIHDIPIARLTSAYLEEMGKLDMVDVDEAAEFLDLASRLLEIKGRLLLPPEETPESGDEEEGDDLDPRSGLVEALLEYRRFKEAALLLGDLATEQSRRYPRVAPRLEFAAVEAVGDADALDLLSAFQAMLLRIVPAEESTEITYTEVPTSVRIEQIETVLGGIGKTRFSLLLSSKPTRREMVGFFIAILEMVRQGRLVARQTGNFSDIILEKAERRPLRQALAGVERKGFGRIGVVRAKPAPPAFPAPPRRPAAGGSFPRRRRAPQGLFSALAGSGRGRGARASAKAPRFFC